MINSATAQPVSHVLLFDTGTPQQVREMGDNTRVVSDCYKRLLFEESNRIMEMKYRVIFAVPDESGLAQTCEDASAKLKAAGVHAQVARVKAQDMTMWQGKVGLLSCVLSRIAGAVLLNEILISEEQAQKLLL